LLKEAVSPCAFSAGRGVWVPAFSGTTLGEVRRDNNGLTQSSRANLSEEVRHLISELLTLGF
jgi:hypothetical protein